MKNFNLTGDSYIWAKAVWGRANWFHHYFLLLPLFIFLNRKKTFVALYLWETWHNYPETAFGNAKLLLAGGNFLFGFYFLFIRPSRSLRSSDANSLSVPRTFSKFGYSRFSICGSLLCNNLPNQIKMVQSLSQFKMLLKTRLYALAFVN